MKGVGFVPFEGFLILGMIVLTLVMIYCGHIYSIPVWKTTIIAIAGTLIGILGAHLMYYIENMAWGGRSFFGAVFLVPILMWPVAKTLRVQYGSIMDICAPAVCIMLAVLKIKCKIDGCCYGKTFYTVYGTSIQFPSQIVELIVGVVLAVFSVLMIKSVKWHGLVYAWVLLLYGIIRFGLNFFRVTTPWLGPIAAGTVWSVVSFVIGATSIIVLHRNNKQGSIR